MKVVNLRKEKYDVYIGRGSKWGNPYKIGLDGTREEVIQKYEDYLRKNDNMLKELKELDNKVLGCYCKPQTCHGDILIKVRNEQLNEGKEEKRIKEGGRK